MITALDIIPHKDYFSLVVTAHTKGFDTQQVYAYIHPVDGAWVVVSIKGTPTMVCMDVPSLVRRLHHRYSIVPSVPTRMSDYTK